MAFPSTTPALTVAFPSHPTLNPTGQYNKLQRNGTRWALLNTTTGQTKALVGKGLTEAMEAVIIPTLA